MLVIVDYGMGNLRTVCHKIGKIADDVKLASEPQEILEADRIVLPGVGHFAAGMRNLTQSGILGALEKKVLNEKTPILGICLGMQLFSQFSEEGGVEGLGWIDAKTKKFSFETQSLRIPHVGFNDVRQVKKSALFEGVPDDYKFYFTHSYHVVCEDEDDVLAYTDYGFYFVSAIMKNNIFGVQFHPEKSHKTGMNIIRNFVEKC